jgi:putative pyruvate formate lyase activating enzyme
MKCIYCQNSPWSWKGEGKDLTIRELTDIFRTLACTHKCENWNLVSPTPYLPFIREAVAPLKKEGISLPFVFNSSGYERVETLKEYSDLCDIALVDLRYSNDKTALEASAAGNYVKTARETLKYLWEHLGLLDSDSCDNPAKRGVICRILVLPGHAEEAVENLEWIANELSNQMHVSIMSHYAPAYIANEREPWNRVLWEEEYDKVTQAACDMGFDNGWIQSYESRDQSSDLVGENMTSGEGVVGQKNI